jgi:hypothetical protein
MSKLGIGMLKKATSPLSKATKAINSFIEEVFNVDGSHNSKEFFPNPSAHNCRFCPFKDNKELCDKGLI